MDAAGVVVGVMQGSEHGGGDLSRVVLGVGVKSSNGVQDFAAIEKL